MGKIIVPQSRQLLRIPGGQYAGKLRTDHPLGLYLPPAQGTSIAWAYHNARSSLDAVPAGQGYKQIAALSGARVILVSPTGNDNNVGYRVVSGQTNSQLIDPTGVAVQTLDKARTLVRHQTADIILLDADDQNHIYAPAWDQFVFDSKSGFSPTERLSLGWFSPNNLVATHGKRPRLQCWAVSGLNKSEVYDIRTNNAALHNNWLIQSVEFIDQRAVFGHAANAPYQSVITDIINNVYTENQETGVYPHSQIQIYGNHKDIDYQDVVFHCVEPIPQHLSDSIYPERFNLFRCIWRGGNYYPTSYKTQLSRPSNLYMKGVKDFRVERCFMRHGGWNPNINGAAANQYNHSMYLSEDNYHGGSTVINKNFVIEPSSHGIQLRSGGTMTDNIIDRAAYSIGVGTVVPGQTQDWINNAVTQWTIANNVICNGLTMAAKPNSPSKLVAPSNTGLFTPGTGALLLQAVKNSPVYTISGNIINKALRGQQHQDYASYPFFNYGDVDLDTGPSNGFTLYPNQISVTGTKSYKWNTTTQNQGVYSDPENKDIQSYVEIVNGSQIGELGKDYVFDHYENRPIMGTNAALEIESVLSFIRDGFQAA